MKTYFEKLTTSEFWLMFASSSMVIYLMSHSTAIQNQQAIGLTILISGYMISRCLYKQMRSAAQVKGWLTSELQFLLTGVGAFAYFAWKERMSVDSAILLSSIILGVYFISRGMTKRIGQRQTPFL